MKDLDPAVFFAAADHQKDLNLKVKARRTHRITTDKGNHNDLDKRANTAEAGIDFNRRLSYSKNVETKEPFK